MKDEASSNIECDTSSKRGLIFKQSFINTCKNSTFHALSSVFRNEKITLQVFWAILFLFGATMSIYCKQSEENYNNFRQFFENFVIQQIHAQPWRHILSLKSTW
jgi:hypothetical protein